MRPGALMAIAAVAACGSFGAEAPSADGGAAPPPPDGAPGPDAGNVSCAHTWCSSFDGPGLDSDWGGEQIFRSAGGQTLERTTESPVAGPFALRATIDGTTAGGRYLHKIFGQPARELRFGFRFRVTKPTTLNDEFQIATLGWSPNAADLPDMMNELQLRIGSSTVRPWVNVDFPDGGEAGFGGTNGPAHVVGQWRRVEMRVADVAGEILATCLVDDVKLLERSFRPSAKLSEPEVGLGIVGAFGTFTRSIVDFDEAWVDVQSP